MSSSVSESKLAKVANKLVEYEQMIIDAKQLFDLDDKNLEQACKHQAFNLMKYDVAFQECKSIQDLLELQKDSIKSLHWKRLNERHSKTLSTRDIEAYISGEQDFLDISELVLEVMEIRRKLEAITEAFRTLGWSLSNIVKLRIHQMEHVVL